MNTATSTDSPGRQAAPDAAQAAINYILREARNVDWIELAGIFIDDEDDALECSAMRHALASAVRRGQLCAQGAGIDRAWAPAGYVFPPDVIYPEDDADPWVGPIVPPRQIDVMHAPVYVPPSSTPAREGALDAARLPSRGFRC